MLLYKLRNPIYVPLVMSSFGLSPLFKEDRDFTSSWLSKAGSERSSTRITILLIVSSKNLEEEERIMYLSEIFYSLKDSCISIKTRSIVISVVLRNTTQTKDHCLNCLFNDPTLNWSVPFKLKPLFTKSDID